MKFSIMQLLSKCEPIAVFCEFIQFTEEVINEKLHFLFIDGCVGFLTYYCNQHYCGSIFSCVAFSHERSIARLSQVFLRFSEVFRVYRSGAMV